MAPVLPHVVLADGEPYTASVRRLRDFNYHGVERGTYPGGHLAAFHPSPRDSNGCGYGVRVGTPLCVPGIPPPRDLDELEARLAVTMPHARLVRVHDAAQREDLTPRLRCALGKVRKTVDAFFQVKPTETVMPSSSHHHKLIVALAQLGCSVTLSSSAVHVETNTSAYSEYLNLTGVQKIGACEDNYTQSPVGAKYWCLCNQQHGGTFYYLYEPRLRVVVMIAGECYKMIRADVTGDAAADRDVILTAARLFTRFCHVEAEALLRQEASMEAVASLVKGLYPDVDDLFETAYNRLAILTDLFSAGLVLNGRTVQGAEGVLGYFNVHNAALVTGLRRALAAYLEMRPTLCNLVLGGETATVRALLSSLSEPTLTTWLLDLRPARIARLDATAYSIQHLRTLLDPSGDADHQQHTLWRALHLMRGQPTGPAVLVDGRVKDAALARLRARIALKDNQTSVGALLLGHAVDDWEYADNVTAAVAAAQEAERAARHWLQRILFSDTEADARRRLQRALQVARKRQREATLDMGGDVSDSDDELPPPKQRCVRARLSTGGDGGGSDATGDGTGDGDGDGSDDDGSDDGSDSDSDSDDGDDSSSTESTLSEDDDDDALEESTRSSPPEARLVHLATCRAVLAALGPAAARISGMECIDGIALQAGDAVDRARELASLI